MHCLDDELSQRPIGWYHDPVFVKPPLQVVHQLAALRSACELFLEPTNDISTLMLGEDSKIYDCPSEALMVGQCFEVTVIE